MLKENEDKLDEPHKILIFMVKTAVQFILLLT